MISYRNFPVDSVTVDVQYRDAGIVINTLNFSGRSVDSALYRSILGVDSLLGRFDYACNMRGSTDFLEGEITAEFIMPGYRGYIVDSAFVSAAISGSNIELNNLDIHYKDLSFCWL